MWMEGTATRSCDNERGQEVFVDGDGNNKEDMEQ